MRYGAAAAGPGSCATAMPSTASDNGSHARSTAWVWGVVGVSIIHTVPKGYKTLINHRASRTAMKGLPACHPPGGPASRPPYPKGPACPPTHPESLPHIPLLQGALRDQPLQPPALDDLPQRAHRVGGRTARLTHGVGLRGQSVHVVGV